jgi:hypothetical protein
LIIIFEQCERTNKVGQIGRELTEVDDQLVIYKRTAESSVKGVREYKEENLWTWMSDSEI